MSEWLALHWPELSFGFVCGVICSLTRLFWERVLFAGGLALAIYFLMVRAAAHAGFRWDNEVAASCVLGAFLGCFVRPALAWLNRRVKSRSPDGAQRNPG
jgi:hypothetical protein